jgi:hypothetical protein
MILFVFLTGQNYPSLNQVDFQTSYFLTLESSIVQSPLQTETRMDSTVFDLGQVTLEVQPFQNEYQFLQTPPLTPSFNIEQVETSTATPAFGDSLSQIVNTLGLQSFQKEDFVLQSPSTSASFNKFERVETSRATPAFGVGQVFDQIDNTFKVQPSQNEDQFLHTPSTSFDNKQFETSTAVDGSLGQIANRLGLQSFQNKDYRSSTYPSFNTEQAEISATNNNQQLNYASLTTESIEKIMKDFPTCEVRLLKLNLECVRLG